MMMAEIAMIAPARIRLRDWKDKKDLSGKQQDGRVGEL